MANLSDLFPSDTKRGRLAELLYQRSIAEPAPVPDVRSTPPQIMGGLLGMIDSAKRRVGKNLSELVNNPDQYLRLIAERLPETAMKQASDPGNFIPGGGMAGTFIGKSAKTWDALKEAEAMKRLAAGENPAQVWKETGIAVAPWDKAARGEIPDNVATGRHYQFTPKQAFDSAMNEAIISGDKALFERANTMRPFVGMTKNEMSDLYKKTGQDIIDAAQSGQMDVALKLTDDRSNSGWSMLMDRMSQRTYGPLSNFMKHGDLGKAYPDAYAIHTRIAPDELGTSKGQYLRGDATRGEQILLSEKPLWSDPKSTAMHELQHAIQQREGWARGGNPEGMAAEWSKAKQDQDFFSTLDALAREAEQSFGGNVDKAAKELNNIGIEVTEDHVAELMRIGAKEAGKRSITAQETLKAFGGGGMYGDAGTNLYKRLAGEAEARLTQARIPMTMEERLAQYPYDPAYFEKATGVKLGDLITRMK